MSRFVVLMMPYGYPNPRRPDWKGGGYEDYLSKCVWEIAQRTIGSDEVVAVVIPGVESVYVKTMINEQLRKMGSCLTIVTENVTKTTPAGLRAGHHLLETVAKGQGDLDVLVLCDKVRQTKIIWLIMQLRARDLWSTSRRCRVIGIPRRDVSRKSTWWFQGLELLAMRVCPWLLERRLRG